MDKDFRDVKSGWLLLIVLLVVVCACSKANPPVEPQTAPSVDHIVHLSSGDSKDVVHGVFPVKRYAQFAFVVPPSQGYSRLHGDFRAFTKRLDPDSTSDKTADISLMLLNGQEFDDFVKGRPGSTTYQLDPAHDQAVDWQVPLTYDRPEEYHLVFSNSAGGPKTKFVKADFTLSYQ
ncbi:MAG: hypothetical protein WB711_05955 [Terriglobales bacterium]